MEFSLQEIANMISGELVGDGSLTINNVGKIEEAGAGAISFLANPRYEKFLYSTKASAVIIAKDFEPSEEVPTTLIKTEDPYSAFTQLLETYEAQETAKLVGVENPAFMDESSTIGENCYRGAFSYIGKNCKIGNKVKIHPQSYIGDNVTIGDNAIIHAGVRLHAGTVVGNYCVIKANAVIGGDGFGFAPQPDGSYKRIPQVGNVILEDYVNIGANTVIDCATMGSTIIRKGAKLDNLIQIAHNVEVGENTVMASQVGIAGSSKIGASCQIGGQAGFAGHITVADRNLIGAQAGVTSNIKEEGLNLIGSPVISFKDYFRAYSLFRKLPQIAERVGKLEKNQ